MKIRKVFIYSIAPFFSFLKYSGFSMMDFFHMLLLLSNKKIRFFKFDYYYLIFIAIGIVSSMLNGKLEGIAYTLRLLLFYLAFMTIRNYIDKKNVLIVVFISILFHLSIYPVYVYNWFVGYLAGLLFFVFWKERNYSFAITCALILYITDQRSLFISLLVAFLMNFINFKMKSLLKLILVIFCIMSFANVITDNRRIGQFDISNVVTIVSVFNIATRMAENQSYDKFVYGNRNTIGDNPNADLSLHLRLKKWAHAYSTLRNEDYLGLAYGLGPGYFGKAADSAYVRLFFETGIFSLFFLFLWYIGLQNKFSEIFQPISVYFILSNIFLDVFFSPLLMSISLVFCYVNNSRIR